MRNISVKSVAIIKTILFNNVPLAYRVDENWLISIQPLGRFLAGTRAQSGDRYGSGTLHSGQVLRGRFPLLSSAFRRSHFRR
jgi:hypothetical protein